MITQILRFVYFPEVRHLINLNSEYLFLALMVAEKKHVFSDDSHWSEDDGHLRLITHVFLSAAGWGDHRPAVREQLPVHPGQPGRPRERERGLDPGEDGEGDVH